MKNKIILGIAVIIIIVGAAYYYNKKSAEVKTDVATTTNKTPVSTNKPVVDETANWTEYKNQTLGYSIKYPSSYKLSDEKVPLGDKFLTELSIQISDPTKFGEFSPHVNVYLIKLPEAVGGRVFTDAESFARYYLQTTAKISSVKEVDLGGVVGVKVTGTQLDAVDGSREEKFESIFAIKNNVAYEVISNPTDYANFSKMMDTFKVSK